MDDAIYFSPDGTSHSLEDVIARVKDFIKRDEKAYYILTIGSDSEERKRKGTSEHKMELTTAIVIYKRGYGGTFFYSKNYLEKTKSLRDKIYIEVLASIETAKHFVPRLRSSLNGQNKRCELEIHIDVGEQGKTREMIKEVVGLVSGNGFVARTKPYSYAASNIADKFI